MPPCCLLCKSWSSRPVIREESWQYYRCERCGLVFLHPQPSTTFLLSHYQSYLPSTDPEIQSWHRLMQGVSEKAAVLIESRVSRPGTLLDVGCGYGFFPGLMSRRGWHAEGIEISAHARRYARENQDIEVTSEPLPRPDWDDGRFDVITLFYVIEHLPDPVETLNEVFRLLKPGGLVLLRWPHTTPIALLLKPWSSRLRLYQAPSHLFDFSPGTMLEMLSGIGYEQIRTTVVGWTHPESPGPRVASAVFGFLGETVARCSHDRWLIPGVSKTTLARKPLDRHTVLASASTRTHAR